MGWDVEVTDECREWLQGLSEKEFAAVDRAVDELIENGPNLGFPRTSSVEGSRHAHMRELRVQIKGRPFRIYFAFDPRRAAILLIGGDKTGDKRFYERLTPIADDLYDIHVQELKDEGLIE